MINPETLKQLKNASIEERISIIEMLAQSLKTDMPKDATFQSESKIQSQRPPFGFMKDTGEISGDVISVCPTKTLLIDSLLQQPSTINSN
jgi:hypothetical protein